MAGELSQSYAYLSEPVQEGVRRIEVQLLPGGFYNNMAAEMVPRGTDLSSPLDVAQILAPVKGAEVPRYRSVEGIENPQEAAQALRKELTIDYKDDILALADAVGQRQLATFMDAQIAAIDPDLAVLVRERGARNTFVVRHAILERAATLAQVDPSQPTHTNGNRDINLLYPDGNANSERPVVARLAPTRLAEGDTTEHLVDVAYGEEMGYITEDETIVLDGIGTVVTQRWAGDRSFGQRDRILVELAQNAKERGLMAAITAVDALVEGGLDGRQLVEGSNGQYRLKGRIQAERWAVEHGKKFGAPAVVLGDEAGLVVTSLRGTPHAQRLTTVRRGPAVYMPEAMIAYREAVRPIAA